MSLNRTPKSKNYEERSFFTSTENDNKKLITIPKNKKLN